MKLEITKRTVILSSRKKVRKGSRTQFLLFVSLLQSSFPLTTELEGSLIVFFGTNTFFCFTQKNSFLYGRRGQTGRYQADIHCCILACCLHNNAILSLVWGWIGLRLFEHLNPAEDWARLKVSAWRWRPMISFIKNTTDVPWMFLQLSFLRGIGLWKDNGSFSYWYFSMGFGHAFTLLHNSEVR